MATDEILLDYVAGRLAIADADAIEAQARQDPDLASRIAVTRGILNARVGDRGRPEASEFGWARLSRAIDRTADTAARNRSARRGEGLRQVWQMAAAAVVAIVGWQAVVVPNLKDRSGNTEAVYRTAGDTATLSYSAQVAFRPEAREQHIRVLLSSAKASIARGPTALGLYQIVFADEVRLQRGVAILRQKPDVVESVEIN